MHVCIPNTARSQAVDQAWFFYANVATGCTGEQRCGEGRGCVVRLAVWVRSLQAARASKAMIDGGTALRAKGLLDQTLLHLLLALLLRKILTARSPSSCS